MSGDIFLKLEGVKKSFGGVQALKGVDLVGFGKYEHSLGSTRGEKEFNVTLGVNVYQNRQTAQGIIRAFKANKVTMTKEESTLVNLHQLSYKGDCEIPSTTVEQVEKYLDKPFGTLIVCFSADEYDVISSKSEKISSLPMLVAGARMLGPVNSVIVCPQENFEYSYYDRVIFAGKPLSKGYMAWIKDAVNEVYTLGDCTPTHITIDDDAFRVVFREMRRMALMKEHLVGYNRLLSAVNSVKSLNYTQLMIILAVFKELKLVTVSDKGVINVSNDKTDLNKSAIYLNVKK